MTTVFELQSCFGPCNVSRRFVPSFTRLVSPLKSKVKKGKALKLDLDKEKIKAVKILIKKLSKASVQALPRAKEQYTIYSDACDTHVWCVIPQEQGGKVLKPYGI